jgi:hypothetical protein
MLVPTLYVSQQLKTDKVVLVAVLACTLIAVLACAPPLPVGQSGSIAMRPFVDKEQGIRGNAPLEGWSDRALLRQQSFSGTRDEWIAMASEQTDLVQMPRSVGTYEGAYLTWDLYTFVTRIAEAGPALLEVQLALAQNKAGSRQYTVLLVTPSPALAADRPMNQAVYEHALYAFEPLE